MKTNSGITFKLFFIVVAFAGLLFSCKKLKDLLTFTISNESTFTVSSSTPLNLPFDISSPNTTTNSTQQFQNNNSDANHVNDIRLQSLQVTITSPPNQTFAFLQSIHVYISTNSTNEILLASLDSVPATATSIALTPAQAKLDSYVKAATFNLRIEIVTRQLVTQDVNMNIDSKFKVTANL